MAQKIPRHVITQEDVAKALRTAGVEVDAPDVRLQADITSIGDAPSLTLRLSGSPSPAVLRIRVACKSSAECLPFYALANLKNSAAAGEAKERLTPEAASRPQVSTVAHLSLIAGQRALLFVQAERLQLQMPVIAIDSGCFGAEVRVASLDRKQTYRGTVAGDGTVRGTLP